MTSIQRPTTTMTPRISKEVLDQIPCPTLRTLVNEGRLTLGADGVVELAQLDAALASIGVAGFVKKALVNGADATRKDHAGALLNTLTTSQFNILKLRGGFLDHEGDTRILRNAGADAERIAWLKQHSSDGKTVTLDDVARAQKEASRDEKAGFRAWALGIAELGALVLVFGAPNDKGKKALSFSALESLYVENKFPEGWQVREVTGFDVIIAMAKMAFTQAFTNTGRARLGMDKALGRDVALDQAASKGLQNAMCPAGMRPATKPQPVNAGELAAVHSK